MTSGVSRDTVFQDIRPGVGFKTGDFVEEKLGGGGTVERLSYRHIASGGEVVARATIAVTMFWLKRVHDAGSIGIQH